jgi:hypothetical protein
MTEYELSGRDSLVIAEIVLKIRELAREKELLDVWGLTSTVVYSCKRIIDLHTKEI